MAGVLAGERVDAAPYLADLDFRAFHLRVSTQRYHDAAWHAREREALWMRCWQVAGRADEVPRPGDWKVHTIFDQSFLIVRGRDGVLRGFVNSCRHRSNRLCAGSGHAARFTCPYHNWTFALDGELMAVPRPDYPGPLEEFTGHERDELGLLWVPVEAFAGFIFLNPDPAAPPLAGNLGEMMELLAPYRLDEMVPVGLNVREALDCNWKVVIDAFQEGYHIQGVHPELVPVMDEAKERYRFCGDHSVATAPFGANNMAASNDAAEVAAVRDLVGTFPGIAEVLPRFDALVAEHGDSAGGIAFPPGITARLLLQQATRATLTAKGLDVSGLTDTQMSDNQFYVLFPNCFITIRAGEATVIIATPHPDGQPGRCHWLVTGYMWLPPEARGAAHEPLREVPEGAHAPYFLALEQDWVMMQRQQEGLRNAALTHQTLTRQEVRLAHFHAAIDRWMDRLAQE